MDYKFSAKLSEHELAIPEGEELLDITSIIFTDTLKQKIKNLCKSCVSPTRLLYMYDIHPAFFAIYLTETDDGEKLYEDCLSNMVHGFVAISEKISKNDKIGVKDAKRVIEELGYSSTRVISWQSQCEKANISDAHISEAILNNFCIEDIAASLGIATKEMDYFQNYYPSMRIYMDGRRKKIVSSKPNRTY